MKPHITLKLKEQTSPVEAPHWKDIIADKDLAVTRIHPRIDALFSRYRLPVWVTQEYRPAAERWNQAEVASGLNRIYRLILQEDAEIPPELIQEVSLLPVVEEVGIGRIGRVDFPPAHAAIQLSANTGQASRSAIYLAEAHRFTRGDPSIKVAILDTGISLDHPELKGVLLPGFDFVDIIDGATRFIGDFVAADDSPQDEVGHGTHVAGIIAGQGLTMPAGVVPRCRILPVRVLAAMKRSGQVVGAGLVDNINAGVKWAIDQGADVINMSLGVRHTGGGLPHQEVVDYAQRMGVTIVAAAGNDGSEELYYPGALESVIAVGATDEGGDVAAFSTFGRQVSFVAPGTNIYSSYLDRDYAFATGTSHAAPFVAGAVAMLKSHARSKGKNLLDRHAKYVLMHTADKVDLRFKHRKAGFGRLNLADALRLLEYKLN